MNYHYSNNGINFGNKISQNLQYISNQEENNNIYNSNKFNIFINNNVLNTEQMFQKFIESQINALNDYISNEDKIINNIKYNNNYNINNENNINNIDKQQTICQIKLLIEKEKKKVKDFIKLENQKLVEKYGYFPKEDNENKIIEDLFNKISNKKIKKYSSISIQNNNNIIANKKKNFENKDNEIKYNNNLINKNKNNIDYNKNNSFIYESYSNNYNNIKKYNNYYTKKTENNYNHYFNIKNNINEIDKDIEKFNKNSMFPFKNNDTYICYNSNQGKILKNKNSNMITNNNINIVNKEKNENNNFSFIFNNNIKEKGKLNNSNKKVNSSKNILNKFEKNTNIKFYDNLNFQKINNFFYNGSKNSKNKKQKKKITQIISPFSVNKNIKDLEIITKPKYQKTTKYNFITQKIFLFFKTRSSSYKGKKINNRLTKKFEEYNNYLKNENIMHNRNNSKSF